MHSSDKLIRNTHKKKLQKEKEKQTKSIQDKDNRIKDLQETNE